MGVGAARICWPKDLHASSILNTKRVWRIKGKARAQEEGTFSSAHPRIFPKRLQRGGTLVQELLWLVPTLDGLVSATLYMNRIE